MKKTLINITALILLNGCGVTNNTSGNGNGNIPITSGVDAFSKTDNNTNQTTLPKSSPVINTDTADEKKDAISSHNNARQKFFNNSDLVWSDTLEKSAQDYANTLSQNGQFTHSSSGYGENLYASSSSAVLKNGVDSWVNEESAYSYNTNSCINNRVCGHYTQVIWKTTKEVGCAKAIYQTGKYKGWTVVVCQYNPAGNFIGQKPY